jgi:hypothetical protein
MNNDMISIMARVIQDSLPGKLSEELALVLIHIMFVYEIYFSNKSPKREPDFPLEHTLRSACEVIARLEVIGHENDRNYAGWLALYQEHVMNPYEMSPDYQPLISSTIERLSKHPWILDIRREQ